MTEKLLGWRGGAVLCIAAVFLNVIFYKLGLFPLVVLSYLLLALGAFMLTGKLKALAPKGVVKGSTSEQLKPSDWIRIFLTLLFFLLGIIAALWVQGPQARITATALYWISFIGLACSFPWKARLKAQEFFKKTAKSFAPVKSSAEQLLYGRVLLFAVAALALAGQSFLYEGYLRPNGMAKGLTLFLLAAAAAYWALRHSADSTVVPVNRGSRWNNIVFGCVMAAAIFLRTYKLTSFPWGLFQDEATLGQEVARCAGIDPTYAAAGLTYSPFVTDAQSFFTMPYFLIALSFKLFGLNEFAFRLPQTILGILSVFVFFKLAKLLVDERAALAATFIFGCFRIHIHMSRFVSIFPTLFLELCTVYFFLKAFQDRKKSSYILGSLALGLGMYQYVPVLVLPALIGALVVYKFFKSPGFLRQNARGLLMAVLLYSILVAPMLVYFNQHSTMVTQGVWGGGGGRSILSSVVESKSPMPLVKNIGMELLMMNYLGDPLGEANLPGKPGMDFVSGLLFLLGLGFALANWRREKYGVGLVLFFVAFLPSFLAHGNPLVIHGVTGIPVVCLFTGYIIEGLWLKTAQVFPRSGSRAFLVCLLVLAPVVFFMNFKTYFIDYRNNPTVYGVQAGDRTPVSREVARLGNTARTYMGVEFFSHSSLAFLTAGRGTESIWFDLAQNLPVHDKPDKNAVFLLNDRYFAVADLLKTYYPNGKYQEFKDFMGNAYGFSYTVSKEEVAARQGLKGVYTRGGKFVPGTEMFSKVQDFDLSRAGLQQPVRAEWTGSLYCPDFGEYFFQVKNVGAGVATATAPNVWIDDREVALKPGAGALLYRGNHRFRAQYVGTSGFVLLWQRPRSVDAAPTSPLPPLEKIPGEYFDIGSDNQGVMVKSYRKQDWQGAVDYIERVPFIVYDTHTPFFPLSSEWSGKIQAEQDGQYVFGIESNARVWMSVDGKQVFNGIPGWSQQNTVALKKGKHAFVLKADITEYPLALSLYWTVPGQPRTTIPFQAYLLN